MNWFPMGLTYSLLYMGRYNLTVAKNSLSELMTKEDFGIIFATGTAVYALSFLVNGPLVDRIGGRKGILISSAGASLANLGMGLYLACSFPGTLETGFRLKLVFCVLYGLNMYFQSYGAVSIVKVNSHWFHITERGGFSGVFGAMISSGIFLAFTVNGWILDATSNLFPNQNIQWVVFLVPSALLAIFFIIEFLSLKDRPSLAGFEDFDTEDASSGYSWDQPTKTFQTIKKLLTNPIIITVALVEFCTGALRNGIMHWFPIYAKEVWGLPPQHALMNGSWDNYKFIFICFAVAAVSITMGIKKSGGLKKILFILGVLAFLAPFVKGGWGGLLFIAGVIGANVAGWISDLVFQSRRAPIAAILYGVMVVSCIALVFLVSRPSTVVSWTDENSVLKPGDRILRIGKNSVQFWEEVTEATRCWPAQCIDSVWNEQKCSCVAGIFLMPNKKKSQKSMSIPVTIARNGGIKEIYLTDTMPVQHPGDKRSLKAGPQLPFSPTLIGIVVFLFSLSVIGAHGILSGTATMDFGGRKGAATAVSIVDGFVYLGTAVQSLSLGYITQKNWLLWPVFLVPFTVFGLILLVKIWRAKPCTRPVIPGEK